jgi:uncharacterized membrane protein
VTVSITAIAIFLGGMVAGAIIGICAFAVMLHETSRRHNSRRIEG